MAVSFIQRVAQTFVVLLLCLFASVAAAAPELRVFGVNEELEQQIVLSVGVPTHESERSINNFVDGLPQTTNQALAAVGYYSAEIKATREKSRDGDFIDLRVTLNDPVRVNKIILIIEGDANTDRAFMSTLGNLPLQQNAVFISTDYEAAKSRLINSAQDLGYFDFDFTEKVVRVSRKNLSADVTLVANSGERYKFGAVRFDQSVFAETFLKRWTPFEEGDPYSSSKIAEAVTSIQESGYFSSVRVLPQRDARYGKTVPVRIELAKKDNNFVGIGIGYDSDTLFRTKVTWLKPLINSYGHSAELSFNLSEVNQSVSVAYKIPRRIDPVNNYFSIEYGLQNTITTDVDLEGSTLESTSFLSALSFERTRKLKSDWRETTFIRWERETSTFGEADPITTDLVLPGVNWFRTRSKGSPFITWGQATNFRLSVGSKEVLSTVDLIKLDFRFKYIRAISKRNTLITSLQYGAIETNDFDRLPITQRFFAGGDQSIRGFEFRQVSPRDEDNVAIGGQFLEALSLEHNYRFLDNWSSAVFVDAGRAFSDFDEPYSVGAGVGIRWQSPVGPFRLDLAVPVSDNEERDFRFHISLGPDI